MTVHFIGAGPGAPDLITLRGRDLIKRCPVCLYAGSLVPRAVVAFAPKRAQVIDTAGLDLDAIIALIQAAHAKGQDVARVHSGDPSLYGAIAEQMRRLDSLKIPYTVTPGVPAFATAAAALRTELTLPGVAQSVVLTRLGQRASAMPKGETLKNFARTGATLAIHLGIQGIARIVAELTPHYGAACPVAVVVRASWPDELILRGTLKTIAAKVARANIKRTALILVGPALRPPKGFRASALYDAAHDRHLKPVAKRLKPRAPRPARR